MELPTRSTPPHCSLLSSPFSSPNVAALLKIKILSWSQETGFPVCIRVRIADRTFNLHKNPLTCKSGYFREKLEKSNEVELPPNFPGGAETFEMIALFIYGSSTLVDPFNVAALRCAAEFLHMTEEYGTGNLCQRFDIYLNQVVLQSWNDTLIVLQKCQTLLPLAEELLIVSRCIETLAFMACMEILDPERRRDQPVVTLETLACRPWSDEMVKNIISQDLWIKDLIALPLAFFKRVIGSLRRQGMKEKYVSPIILFYADKWVILRNTANEGADDSMKNLEVIMQVVVDLLPNGVNTSKGIPVGFYFSLLSTSVELGLRNDSVEKLQNQIALVLHLAQVQDFLLPKDDKELSIMETIFSTYFSCVMESDCTPVEKNYAVAESWDMYLNVIAADSELCCKRFMNLIETVPVSSRQTHDHLYRAVNTFFQSHPNLSQEEKGLVCKYLNCQKLSQEVCIEAVQNELMPLRLIVQALFVQQLNTQQAFRECSDSFRYTHCGEFSGSVSSSRYANSRSQNLGESPYINGSEGGSRPLSFLLQKDASIRRPELSSEISRKDYESTSFRIQNLEKELMSLKMSLRVQQISKKNDKGSKKVEPVSENLQSIRPYGLVERRMSKKKNPLGQVTSCIGTVNFGPQRKYANRLLKVLRRISLFGRGRSKRKSGASAMSL
ncbi:BTB/POZ domain-containing protein At5g48130 [Sesamum indicum]|uniref:BTB/POZ domain-containing protein At5g48130 n=1 Tax=Sesamum indicum TaxID=4182 RepID=A0A6I9TJG3_SESIN|nr:BTB/POZ domain-containing protein At5g48130 [Sesamum indicum]